MKNDSRDFLIKVDKLTRPGTQNNLNEIFYKTSSRKESNYTNTDYNLINGAILQRPSTVGIKK